MGCHSLLQGIFLIQGSNLGLLHFKWILYHLSYQGRYNQKKKKKIRAKQCKTESWIAWYDEAENINRSIEGSVMSWHYLVFRKYLLKETYILSIDKEEPVVCLLNYSCRSYHQPHHDSLGLSSPKEVSYSLPTSQFCCP